MSENRYVLAGKAIKFIFFGQLLGLFSVIPSIGTWIALIGGILLLIGIFKARKIDTAFNYAFIIVLLNSVIMSAITFFITKTLFEGNANASSLLAAALIITLIGSSIVGFLQNFFILKGTGKLLGELNEENLVRHSKILWKCCALTYVINSVISIFVMTTPPYINLLTSVSSLVSITFGVFYTHFLYKSEVRLLEEEESIR